MINFFFQLFMMRVKQGEIKKGSETQLFSEPYLRTPSGTRTLDPLIKSQLLYQLSYEVIILSHTDKFRFAGANMQQYF